MAPLGLTEASDTLFYAGNIYGFKTGFSKARLLFAVYAQHLCTHLLIQSLPCIARAKRATISSNTHLLHCLGCCAPESRGRTRNAMDFRAAAAYAGPLPGSVFTTRNGRTGYYADPLQPKTGAAIDAILDQADDADVDEIDEQAVKKLLLALEKRITRNAQLRVKYSDRPAKFLESEVDLDDAVKALGLCAAAPEFYGEFARLDGVASVVSLLAHENADIAGSAIALLFDLTDADDAVGDDAQGGHRALVAALVTCDGLATLAQALDRFDEAVAEEAQARHHALGVFEHVVEHDGVVEPACATLGPWLAKRIVAKRGDDAVKLYAAEVLSILCGRSDACASTLASPETIDALLWACAKYKKADPAGPDDEELLENLFQSLTALLNGAPQTAVPEFVRAEGVELMLRCLSEGRASAAPALRVLAASLEHPREDSTEEATGAPRRVLAADGMRHLFPALMGRGAARGTLLGSSERRAKKRRKRRRGDDQKALDEHVVACLASLCLYAAHDDAPDQARPRLVRKFLEGDQEKVKRVLERYAFYMREVILVESSEDPLETLARALGAGLHALRLCGVLLAFCAVFAPACRPMLVEGLGSKGVGELANCVADLADAVHDGNAAVGGAQVERARVLRTWAGAVAALAPEAPS